MSKKDVRYKNKPFLVALGRRCKRLRKQKGYSIDRAYKEGEQLSPATIQRLETGAGDVHISSIYRYAEVLEIPLSKLFDFEEMEPLGPKIVPFEYGKKPPTQSVPFYSLEIAAGSFTNESSALEPEGWVRLDRKGSLKDFFAARVTGHSMEPLIPSGSVCLFKKYTGGSRQGKILVVQARGLADPESGGRFVVKKYLRKTSVSDSQDRRDVVIHLLSENSEFAPIILKRRSEEEVSTPAIFVEVL